MLKLNKKTIGVCHIGYDSYNKKICIYDTANSKIIEFKSVSFNDRNFNWKPIFKGISAAIKEKKIGSLAAYIWYCKNDIRKRFIESGKKYGFEDIEIVDFCTAAYLSLALQTEYKPKNGDIIWIIFSGHCNIYEKENGTARFVDSFKFFKETNCNKEVFYLKWKPTAIFVEFKNLNYFDRDKTREMFPSCILESFSSKEREYSAMIKARIMANDPEVVEWNIQNELRWGLFIKQSGENVVKLKTKQSLPLTKSFKLKNITDPIVIYYGRVLQEEIANPGIISCKIIIDKDEIFEIRAVESVDVVSSNYTLNQEETDEEFSIFDALDSHLLLPEISSKDNNVKESVPFSRSLKPFKFPSKISKNNDKIEAVGIDLGTSRCCAAVNRRNGIETVALENAGGRLLPSYVSYDEAQDKCGQIVIDRMKYHAKSTVFDSKRIIGRSIKEIEIDSIWPFSVSNFDDQVQIEVLKCSEVAIKKPEEVSASLLKYVREKCQHFQGKILSKAVVTIPAVFTESQKEATIKAGKKADFQIIELLPEPIAASFAYFIDRPIPNQSTILLFDLGGGTLDVCISKIENNQIQIISQNGDPQLGGRDFDKILINFFQNLLVSKYGISMFKNKCKLMLECQKLKESLSVMDSGFLDVEEFDPLKEGIINIGRNELEEMTLPLLIRIKSTISAALFDAKLEPTQIDKVLQVGGGSRMPMVKNLLKNMFPSSQHCCAVNPDEVVAVGAAYYAYTLFSNSIKI